MVNNSYCGLLGYETVKSDMWLSNFQRNTLPRFSTLKMEAAYTSETLVARLHFVVTQKTKMYLLLDIIRLIEI